MTLKLEKIWKKQGIRKELWWKKKDSTSRKEKVLQAPYTILPNERAEIFEFIKDAKYPYGYAALISGVHSTVLAALCSGAPYIISTMVSDVMLQRVDG
ncbi:unnamed protein product [Rhodiola kirilowii]